MKSCLIMKREDPFLWDDIPEIAVDTVNWDKHAEVSASAQICWDERALYVRLKAQEAVIRAENSDPLSQPCEDSCLEFFFMPDADDPAMRYFNIEYNPNGLCFLGFGCAGGGSSLIRLLPFRDDYKPKVTFLKGRLPLPSSAAIPEEADGWMIEYEIPASFVSRFFPGFTWHAGLNIRANIYKCSDLTPSPHFLSWNPMDPSDFSFHRPQFFGKMKLS